MRSILLLSQRDVRIVLHGMQHGSIESIPQTTGLKGIRREASKIILRKCVDALLLHDDYAWRTRQLRRLAGDPGYFQVLSGPSLLLRVFGARGADDRRRSSAIVDLNLPRASSGWQKFNGSDDRVNLKLMTPWPRPSESAAPQSESLTD